MLHHINMNLDFALNAALCRRNHPWHSGHLHDGTPNVKIREVLGVPDMSFDEIIDYLKDMKAQGFEVIPGEGCAHLPNGRCPGHVYRGAPASKLHN